MKLSVYYESNYKRDYVWLDTEDADLSVMIERDYQERLAKAQDGEVVERRDPQEILDETSKEIYNSHHRYARRSVLASALDPEGKRSRSAENPEEEVIRREESAALRAAINRLPTRQARLLNDLFFNGYSQRELADRFDIRENSMSDRKRRALASLKKILEKSDSDHEVLALPWTTGAGDAKKQAPAES